MAAPRRFRRRPQSAEAVAKTMTLSTTMLRRLVMSGAA